MNEAQSNLVESKWAQGLILRIDGIVFADGKVILVEYKQRAANAVSANDFSISSSDVTVLLEAGAEWTTVKQMERFELADENLRLTSGGGENESEGFVAAEELAPGRLLWMAHFSFSNSFFTAKFGDDSLIADSTSYLEWKFPLRNPEALTIRPSEEGPPTPKSQAEIYFQGKYPVLYDFMETTLWEGYDGQNVIELLHSMTFSSNPDRARRTIEELKNISCDSAIEGGEISLLFNRSIEHPFQVVNPDNAKDFCYSMHQSLSFVVTLTGKRQGS